MIPLPKSVTPAREFATKAHAGQTYGDKPYTVHLDALDALLVANGYAGDEDLRQVGFLHDVIEDTEATADDLTAAGFPDEVVMAVMFCSDEEGHNRKTRKRRTYRRMSTERRMLAALPMAGAPGGAYRYILLGIRAKLADRLVNLQNALRDGSGLADMYWKERDTFREALYLEGTADNLWDEYDRLLAERPPHRRHR